MKTIQTLIFTAFLVSLAACSKQENTDANNQAPNAELPAMVKPMEATPSAMLPNEIKADDTTTAIEQNDSGKKVLFWYDPMVEGRRFSKSGQSPFMDMKLAPQYAVDVDKGSKP